MSNELQEVRWLAGCHPDWMEYEGGQIVYQSIIMRQYPHINIDRLCTIYDDHRGDWALIVEEYEGAE